ncbi:helix-turn-helix transcriptional regulator [Burkholderia sp. WTPI3]|jgi:prophage regulatory protein|uniref:helix-turn-helix transcriptional regulator n=1 Tax=Burkholderia sp. WTPI3 TaxID=2822167 RepID=UPI001F2AEC60|nr:AlpA family transcriptional regulator [Burkholderia sp. WTPI3]
MQTALNILRMPQVMAKTGLSRGGVYFAMHNSGLPKPIPLGKRASGWIESELDAWIKSRADARK